eukprot:gene32521-39321_t
MGGGFRDGAGDWVQGWTVKGPVSTVEVRVQGQVETTDLAGVLRGHRELVPPLAYLRSTPATEADDALRALADSAAQDVPLSHAHALAFAVAAAAAPPAAPAASYPAPTPGSFNLEQLKGALPSSVDPTRKEEYLSDADFQKAFGMDRNAFKALAKWKRDDAKKKVGIF